MMNNRARSALPISLRIVLAAIGVSIATSCASVPLKTPVRGESDALAKLQGDWEGTYESADMDRSGVISFRLRAGRDTAEGEVLMVPRVRAAYSAADDPSASRFDQPIVRALPIRFVYAEGDEVLGVLEPYEDPACGCMLTTRFLGRIGADVIEGSYRSEANNGSSRAMTGKWRVQRRIVAN